MWCVFFVIVIVVTNASPLSLGNPFLLQNTPAALTKLATSASASASAPSAPITHIADLRKKQQKAEQLQSEKLLVADDADTDLSVEGTDEGDNEAAPTLWQKKIGKILRKIKFLSGLAARPNGNGGGGDAGEATTDENLGNATVTPTTEKPETNDTIGSSEDIDNDVRSVEETTTQRPHTFQKIIYPHSKYDTPLRVSFDINEKIVNEAGTAGDDQESQNIEKVGDTSRLGQIGVFFAEILGSIVGLVYGAAAHITSGTSEGARNLE